ncbi:MAG TPA: ATP-binding protein [Mycobacteriales bacterium]|nr:ATP-binding protein [Mycobacteriales bacterium]
MNDEGAESASRAALRARLAAADASNRQVQRALHDGVQQDLIALSVQLQLARRLADSDPAAASTLLDEMGDEVRAALRRVQQLGEEIYPAMLDARGLPDALAAVAAAVGVPAGVEDAGVGRLAAEVELALYFCGRAALENVAAHAGASAHATIRLHRTGSAVGIEIADDGDGFDPADRPPTGGLSSARDRMAALDGQLTIRSQPGEGTRVEATVPI